MIPTVVSGDPNGPGIRWITIRKASLRNSSVGGGDLRNSGMRVAEGCLERKLLKRGVISVMFADCGRICTALVVSVF